MGPIPVARSLRTRVLALGRLQRSDLVRDQEQDRLRRLLPGLVQEPSEFLGGRRRPATLLLRTPYQARAWLLVIHSRQNDLCLPSSTLTSVSRHISTMC